MAENENAKDDKNWIERNSTVISTLATVAIPVVIAIFGFFANRSLQQDQLDQSYVVLAINTLKTELPVNERKECVATVNKLEKEGSFDTAADLARAFQNGLSGPVGTDTPSTTTVADSDSTGTNLPQTLFRSYALDLLLASTPATLTVPQYKALLCAETIVPPLTEPPADPGADAQESNTTDELFNRLEENAVAAGSGCRVKITQGEVDVVGDNSLSANNEGYVVTRVAIDQIPAPTGSEGESTEPATNVLYLEVEVDSDSSDADEPTVVWVRSQPNIEIEPNREACTP